MTKHKPMRTVAVPMCEEVLEIIDIIRKKKDISRAAAIRELIEIGILATKEKKQKNA